MASENTPTVAEGLGSLRDRLTAWVDLVDQAAVMLAQLADLDATLGSPGATQDSGNGHHPEYTVGTPVRFQLRRSQYTGLISDPLDDDSESVIVAYETRAGDTRHDRVRKEHLTIIRG